MKKEDRLFKRRILSGFIFLAAGGILLGLLFWYGANFKLHISVQLGGGQPVLILPDASAGLPEPDISFLPGYGEPAEPVVPPLPEPPDLPIPKDLVFDAVYRFDAVCIEFTAAGTFRLFSESAMICIQNVFTVISEAGLLARTDSDEFIIVVGYRTVTVQSVQLSDLFGIQNPLYPGRITLSLLQE